MQKNGGFRIAKSSLAMSSQMFQGPEPKKSRAQTHFVPEHKLILFSRYMWCEVCGTRAKIVLNELFHSHYKATVLMAT